MTRALLVLFMMLASGCATGTTARVERTGGLVMTMYWHEGRNSAALYKVDKSGMLSFGGGRDAFADATTWEGPMTDDEIAELKRLVAGWYDRDPRGGGDVDAEVDVRLSGPGGRANFTAPADANGVPPVLDLLRTASRRRLQSDLDTLPRPSGQ